MANPIPVLQPKIIFGLRPNINGNINFISDEEGVYPVGNVLAIHNFTQNRQRIIKLNEKLIINLIIVSPNKKLIALFEKGEKPSITLYDTGTLKKKKVFNIPVIVNEVPQAKEFITAQFTIDNKYIMAVTGEPDWMLYCYNWEKGKIECYTKALNPNGTGTIVQMACNPGEPTTLSLIGDQLIRLLTINESVFRQWGFSKGDLWNLTSCCWISPERLVCGSIDGMLHIIQNGEYLVSFNAATTDIFHFRKKESSQMELTNADDSSKVKAQPFTAPKNGQPIRHLTALTRGFCYTYYPDTIYLYEKVNPLKYFKRNVFKVPPIRFREGPQYEAMTLITCIAANFSEDRLGVTTPRTQIYTTTLWGPDLNEKPEIELIPFGAALHHGTISTIALCAWKSILITCGELDRSLRVWDYEKETLIAVKEFEDDIFSVALHPSGLFVTVGFSDKLRYMILRVDDLEPFKEFSIRACRECQFSSHGQMFAAVNGYLIQIYSTISFELLYTLRGHNGKIVTLSWSAYDLKLSSCGLEGAIYEWDLTDPSNVKRSSEYITKQIPYTDCAVTSDGKSTYAIGIDGNLKLVTDSVCVKNYDICNSPLDSLAKARSDQMIFLAGINGTIYSLKVPIDNTFNEYKIHAQNITRLRLSYDDKLLVSVGVDGTIVIWRLLFTEGKTIRLEKEFSHCDEVLVTFDELREKNQNILELTTRLHELQNEHEYRFRSMETKHAEETTEIHASYIKIIEELEEKIQRMENDHLIEINNINSDISKMKAQHEQMMQEQELMFNEKLITEFEKYITLEDKLKNVRKMYENQLEELEESKIKAVQEITDEFMKQLRDKDLEIEEIKTEIKEIIRKHETIKAQIEDDADREILELRTVHEKALREEQEANVKLRSEVMITRKKYQAANKSTEDLRNKVRSLKDDHSKFQQIINKLESDTSDLKKEITERDQTIQFKEKLILELKKKNQELEKFRYVMNYKIMDLKKQMEPKDNLINQQKLQIEDMIKELKTLQGKINNLELQITDLKEKLRATESDCKTKQAKFRTCKTLLHRMQTDLHHLTLIIQEPQKLKFAIKEMYHRYNEGRDFQIAQLEDAEARNEFLVQREYLERTVRRLKQAAHYHSPAKSENKIKLIEQSSALISETNELRRRYKECLKSNIKMEAVLGITNNQMAAPKEAREKLNNAVKTREEIHEKYKSKIENLEKNIKILKEENHRLLTQILSQKPKDSKELVEEGPSTLSDIGEFSGETL